jgi:3-oxoacyl-(acyl-carrier-protein) synthase
MRQALSTVNEKVDYINPHATSTPVGDIKEIEAIREVFGRQCPAISATKSLTGHSLGADRCAGSDLLLLMMNNGFICALDQYRRSRRGGRRHADRAERSRQESGNGAISNSPSVSAAPTHAGLSKAP